MCTMARITIYCRRCGKYLHDYEEIRQCASSRRRGQGPHRDLGSENVTYQSNWTNCDACQEEYEVYMYARRNGIPYLQPNPPFN
ncbi:hypothetical protein FocTR4_00016734 [Fusarium oxysporum f. sp. cubense]|uniref:Uncharacterized protein n=2 Tax=Fusarium oxysporum species complex TaxID=171631 RepID=A0A5C6S9N6_FUSOC|nr:hypothetical protein FocTR4_00016734 [Fusarium oxysporum f. sp. cubense]